MTEGKFASQNEAIVDLVEQAVSSAIDRYHHPGRQQSRAAIERGEGIMVTDITAFFGDIER